MRPYSNEALELKLALEAGLIGRIDIIGWAEVQLMAREEYDDDLAEVAMASRATLKELADLMTRLTGDADPADAMRRILGRMHAALSRDLSQAPAFMGFLNSYCRLSNYEVPDFLLESIGLNEDLYCAREGIYGSEEEAITAFFGYLDRHGVR